MITETIKVGVVCEWCDEYISGGEPLILVGEIAFHPECLLYLVGEYCSEEYDIEN